MWKASKRHARRATNPMPIRLLCCTTATQEVRLRKIMEDDCVAGLEEFSSFAGFSNHTQPAPSQPRTVYELWSGVGRLAALALDDAVSGDGPAETVLEHQDKAPPREGKYLLDLCLPACSFARFTHTLIIPFFPNRGTIGWSGLAPVPCCTAATQSRHYGKARKVKRKHWHSRQARPWRHWHGDLADASIQAFQTAAEGLQGLTKVVAPGDTPGPPSNVLGVTGCGRPSGSGRRLPPRRR